jgi:hypothetical protein
MAKGSRVVRPHWFWFVLLDGGIAALVLFVLRPGLHDKAKEISGDRLPPLGVIQALLAGTVVIHAGEALAAGRMAERRGLPRRGWMFQTFIVGFPSLGKLRIL